ncbi:hypothetical protein [Streptomyces sp. NPDC058953]
MGEPEMARIAVLCAAALYAEGDAVRALRAEAAGLAGRFPPYPG